MALETLLQGDKLGAELDFFKKHADALGQLKQPFGALHVPAPAQRPKRATLANIAVCEPPSLAPTASTSAATISLTIKSTKPALVFTLAASPTSTIAALKAALCAAEPTAPPAEQQRWILKGKAMGDAKLLREFPVDAAAGATINLMLTKSVATVPPPALTLSTDLDGTRPALSLATDCLTPPPPAPTGISAIVSKPELWTETFEVLKRHFGEARESDAKEVWEAWLGGAQAWIEPSDKALIRERVGISAMGGL